MWCKVDSGNKEKPKKSHPRSALDPSPSSVPPSGREPRLFNFPRFRKLSRQALQGMHKLVRQRERLDRNPLFAVHLLVQREPERIYW